jgi:hypothetical protein
MYVSAPWFILSNRFIVAIGGFDAVAVILPLET